MAVETGPGPAVWLSSNQLSVKRHRQRGHILLNRVEKYKSKLSSVFLSTVN